MRCAVPIPHKEGYVELSQTEFESLLRRVDELRAEREIILEALRECSRNSLILKEILARDIVTNEPPIPVVSVYSKYIDHHIPCETLRCSKPRYHNGSHRFVGS